MTSRDVQHLPVTGKTNNLFFFIIAIFPAIVLFPFPASVFSTGVDPPLAWVFNFLINGNISAGKNIVFPHGPLAFLMYPLPMGSNLWIAISVHLAARIFLAYSILKLTTRKPKGFMVFAFIASFVLLAINELLLTIIQVIILCYLNYFERRNIRWIIPALIIAPLAFYIKAFVGITSLLVTLSFFGIMLYRSFIGVESRYRLLLFLIMPFMMLFVWIGLYGNLQGILGYFKGMQDLASDNSAAVAVYPVNNWWFTGIALVSGLILIVINRKNSKLNRYTILMGPVIFAIWKYGMAREDYLHTSILFVFVLFSVLVYSILGGRFTWLNSAIYSVIVVPFYLIMHNAFYSEPFKIKVNGLQTIVSMSTHYHYFTDTCNRASDKSIERNKLEKRILEMIGNQTTDIYPWDYTFIAANHLNWQPRPLTQSYATYTRYLDQLNASHFSGDKAPRFIIWELRKISRDIHGGMLESIDGRYLLNDEPDVLLVMLCHYELVATQGGESPVLILRKRIFPLETETKVIAEASTTWNTWLEVPQNSPGILRASLNLSRNTLGDIKNFFYKDEAVYVYYLLENGDIRMYRIVPKSASYGLWINPLVMNPELEKKELSVRKIMFRCSNKAMMEDEIGVKWNQISFLPEKKNDEINRQKSNPVYSFFGITTESIQSEQLFSHNNLEDKALCWSPPDKTRIVNEGRNKLLKLQPGEYSVGFKFPLDSLLLKDTIHQRIVRASVWAKAAPYAKAVYVISIERNGESISWKGVNIPDFCHDQQSMDFVTSYSILDKNLLKQHGLILNVYAWNTGTETVILDDFSVRIEER